MKKTNIKVIDQTQGKLLGVAGDNYRIIIDSEQTHGSYSVFDMLVPPGGGPSPHSHPEIQEFFYVVKGELTYKTETGHTIVKEGGFVHIPYGGDIHCFYNHSDTPAHILCTVMPGGMEKIFEVIGSPVGPGEFLPIPEMTIDFKNKLEILNDNFNQVVYPPDYLDQK